MDISAAQLDVAKARLKEQHLNNVTFVQGDIQSLENLSSPLADLVYARFVLMHLIDPKAALKHMQSLLKTSGVMALQESVMNTCRTSIKNSEFEQYIATMIKLGQHKGVDFNIGDKLHPYCEEFSFSPIESYFLEHHMSSQQAEPFFASRLNEWGPEAVHANLATVDDIDRWKQAMKDFSTNQPSGYMTLAKQAYILAWK